MNEIKRINLRLKDLNYNIFIGQSLLSSIGLYLKDLNLGTDAVIVTNPNIAVKYGPILLIGFQSYGCQAKIFLVPDGEKSKSTQQFLKLVNDIAQFDTQKKIFIVALGGGVIGDLAGFVASVYKRGVPYIQIPTTLLAQIDSAIGGKVGIDLKMGKNLVGSFCHPRIVLSDVQVLTSLSARQIRNGLAEAVKYGVILDATFFSFLEKNYNQILKLSRPHLIETVSRCAQLKANVVKRDEKETKQLRMILNFGHTLGHAIESAAGYEHYQHGEAISLGMLAAGYISMEKRMLKLKDFNRLKNLLSNIGLPTVLQKVSEKLILEKMLHDKKFVGKQNRFVLAERIGRVSVVLDIPLSLIKASLKFISSSGSSIS